MQPRGEESGLWLADADGENPRPFIDEAGQYLTSPVWSPEFRSDHKQTDVYVGEPGDGGHTLNDVRRLTLDDRDDDPRCWTADGRAVVFESRRYGSADLFVQGPDERDARDLVTGPGDQLNPALTPDGAFLLYWELETGVDEFDAPRRLLRVPAEGGPKELVLVDVVSGEFSGIKIEGVPIEYGDLAWSPDGADYYVGGSFFKGGVLAHVDPDGTAQVLQEVREYAGISSPTVSPDGRRLAFRQVTRDSNAWMVEGL